MNRLLSPAKCSDDVRVPHGIHHGSKSALLLSDLGFYEDGPKLFFHIVNQLFMATFSNFQVTRDQLSYLHLK